MGITERLEQEYIDEVFDKERVGNHVGEVVMSSVADEEANG